MTDSRFLLVGLGNPGREYHLSRHNIGFFFLDHLAGLQGLLIETQKMQGLYCHGRAHGHQLYFLKPQTYMNRSGESVRSFVDYFKIPLCNLLILHDDIDLSAGRIKLVAKGGAGGHNGVRSVAQHLGTTEFARLKIGVGRPVVDEVGQGQPVDQFVLGRMGDAEMSLFEQRKTLVAEAVAVFIQEGVDRCMNRINGR
ncbi:peptidyl-tRNA hydrolase [Desulfobulbus propionicus DSM 2032]|jgi:PTH1 family peptidyl-tRNA hydrolase|uniref:Peptidyl-tRNA hydrolase n=1 Tax=Desulfobulbus propionicus (strain ATCC 33891 / DSM 2032 / VKM B-1956 / 1pr3) TaxID=577650 RepID=A0A7U3YNH1_DESPD|nr:peptidyl-tRNA hydrolase [Desulfobulbus propionicus DSM 2032]